jgi:hypothetical protein
VGVLRLMDTYVHAYVISKGIVIIISVIIISA